MTAEQLSAYDVVWNSPSADATGSMPIGNGDVGANVWVEPNGDLLILVSKGDAWDENSSLLKLGRVRITCDPPLLPQQPDFIQRLNLAEGCVEILALSAFGHVGFCIFGDPDSPVLRVQMQAEAPVTVSATVETWRNYPYRIITQTGDMFMNLTGKDPYPTMVTPDEVSPGRRGEVLVWHHNGPRENDAFEINLKLQGLAGFREEMQHPLLGRTFGMAMAGGGAWENVGQRTIRTSGTSAWLNLFALTRHPSTPAAWREHLEKLIDRDTSDGRREANAEWWRAFLKRSSVRITSPSDTENTFRVTQSYLLQRYMNACAGRSEYPIKHNGSLFTVGRPWDLDFRRWGGPGFWFMNQRLVYWPMLADGDFDLMRPWLNLYRDTLPLQMHRTQKYFGHAGAHYPETITFWGAEVSGHYGWTPFEQRERPEAECAYLTYYWSGAVELILILAEYYAHTGDAKIATDYLRPIAEQVLTFYDQHYPRDPDGKIRFEPGQALETWHWAVNPMPEIAGLTYTLNRLLSLDATAVPASLREQAEKLLAILPPVPRGQRDGEALLLPAAQFDKKKNTENPELYCIFPYRLFGVGKPELDLARRTFAKRLHVEHTCWHQDAIQLALLGLTNEAKDFVTRRVAPANHSDSRFPAFWNAFHDWVPDIDHGGVLQLAVQNMLVQCDGRTIRLLPAWPKEWDVDFKLHVPGPAVIEGTVRDGRLESFDIQPPERRADVILFPSPGVPGEGTTSDKTGEGTELFPLANRPGAV